MLLFRKMYRDLLRNKSRSLSLIILTIVALLGASLFLHMGLICQQINNDFKEETHPADIIIDTNPISNEVLNDGILQEWENKFGAMTVETRVFIIGSFYFNSSANRIVHIIGYPNTTAPNLNQFYSPDQLYFTDFDGQNNSFFMEKSYADYYSLQPNQIYNLTIYNQYNAINQNVTFKAPAYSFEYPFLAETVTGYESSTESADVQVMSIYCRNDFLQSLLYENEDFYNQIVIKFDDERNILPFIEYIQNIDNNFSEYIIQAREVKFDLQITAEIWIVVGWLFGILLMILGMFITFSMMNRYIEEQSPQIGTLKALGYSRKQIILHYISYGVLLSLIGALIGIIGGIIVGNLTVSEFIFAVFSLPTVGNALQIGPMLSLLGVSVFFGFFSGWLGSRRTSQITPQSAVRPSPKIKFGQITLIERFIKKISRSFRLNPTTKYELRNLFNQPKKMIRMIIIMVGIITIISIPTILVDQVQESQQMTIDNEQYDLQGFLGEYKPFDDVKQDFQQALNDPNLVCEPVINDFGILTDEAKKSKKVFIYGTQLKSQLKLFEQGKILLQNQNEIIITNDIAKELALTKGDFITMEGSNHSKRDFIILAIIGHYTLPGVYISINEARLLALGNSTSDLVNNIFVSSDKSIPKNLSNSIPYATKILNQEEMTQIIKDSGDQQEKMISLMKIAGLVIGIIMIFTIISIMVSENKSDYISMKSMGVSNAQIYWRTWPRSLFLGLIASLGYFPGFIISYYYSDYLSAQFAIPMMSLALSLNNYIQMLIFGILMTWIAQSLAFRQIFKLKISDVTKEKMFG